MTGSILWMDEGSPCRWRLAKAGGRRDGGAGRIADILFGDFDRARAEAAVRALRRSLPANEILIVRSGCEALEFLIIGTDDVIGHRKLSSTDTGPARDTSASLFYDTSTTVS